MKTRYWILLLSVILVLCTGLIIPLFLNANRASRAEIISNGAVLYVVDLQVDRQITVSSPSGGSNTITVKDGKIGVTEASCPDHYCMARGMCSGGTQIVCLPNRLVIRFLGKQPLDSVVG